MIRNAMDFISNTIKRLIFSIEKSERSKNVTDSVLEVHYSTSLPVTRNNTRWAFHLNEFDQPRRRVVSSREKVKSIHTIINWLDVETSKRYQKNEDFVYCNIYVYDYCYLCQAYIPRVWWDEESVKKVMSGQSLKPRYGETIFELNANALYDWFKKYGHEFGWYSTNDLTILQESANQGNVCIIVAKRKTQKRSGHINAVVPENDKNRAKRHGRKVIYPVESQAGACNNKYITKEQPWWLADKFSEFSFWIHE